MDEHITRLTYNEKEIILIATAHVSQESVALVKETIEAELPDSVCIELDEQRYKNMRNPKAWEDTNIVDVIKSKRVGFLLANMAISAYQKKIAKNLGTNVGGEMIQGITSAEEIGAELVLADRSIQTTFMRIWRKMSFTEKVTLLFNLFFALDDDDEPITEESIQELMQQDMLESVMASMHQDFPKIGEVLINERDQYLANKIKHAPGKKIIAVLGGAHVPGIRQEIYKDQDMELISHVPPVSKASKMVGWIIPAIILLLIIYSFIVNWQTGMEQLSLWVVWNGTLAALGCLLCLAHPLSTLTAFIAAPITSLNPMLACGWFAGLVEAKMRAPTVQDVQKAPEDIFSLKGFYTNRFLKTLLVVILANLGSTIGTLVAGTNMVRNLLP